MTIPYSEIFVCYPLFCVILCIARLAAFISYDIWSNIMGWEAVLVVAYWFSWAAMTVGPEVEMGVEIL